MTIDTATLGSTITASATASGEAQTRLEEDYTNFLKLLTAQISNQDPLEPMDASTFVSQLAQLSQVAERAEKEPQPETETAMDINPGRKAPDALPTEVDQ